MKQYEKYKDTEYDWLLKVPNHWRERSIRSICSLSDERNREREDLELLSVYREYGVIRKSSRDDNHNTESANLSNYKYVGADYLVMNKMKMWQGSLGVSRYEGIVSPAYIVCLLRDKKVSPVYLNYLLRSAKFKTHYNRISYGIRVGQWDMRYDDFKSLKIYLPDETEQEQIVRYLDWQVTMADKFVREKKREIELLRELRQAEINQAVTRGLDPNAPTRPSGIDWIGEIPEHWEVRNFNHHFIFGKGLPITKKDLLENGVEVISYGQIHSKLNNSIGLKKELVRYVSHSYLDTNIQSLLKKGDFVFADTSEDQEGSGNNIYIDADNLIFAGYHTVIARPVNIDNCEYIAYLFQSECWKRQIKSAINGVKVFSITKSILRKTKILFPTPSEQQQIVAHIQKTEERINKAIEDIEKQIKLVAEYKTSLISDVTTGKVDVRGIEVPDYEKEEPATIENDNEDNNE